MPRWIALSCLISLWHGQFAHAQNAVVPGPEVRKYLRVSTAKVILAHVRVIDGTGGPPMSERNITIENGRIAALGPAADLTASADTTVLDLRGYSVIPGIVGMHGHLWFFARPNLQAD